ncbi:peroxiredoxin family protein [Pseudobacillus badius]|uniref:peroxiredoxin family protein n=1 Tax=Bacillus badius TaxID=1455 RepID=UPI0007B07FBF|nr:TlpA disulfide reductase family protein [Bacillus badius]KZN99139.1 hypothetical protein A4244_08600 [Bacillus badius]MED0665091.1 TlpA disulfide reductase family protein [Bacillus badius]OCS84077.1 hypothetical protein A6M11_08615 [Bacillus badius]OVE52629.1 hypothetical protein B1A98_03215 [Bacillus badius]TDW04634.1 peroxiredoxin [Bacillus badius]
MKRRVFGMVISVFIIIIMFAITIKTNFISKDKRTDGTVKFEEYSNGTIEDSSDELVAADFNSKLKKGTMVPSFKLKNLSGETISLSDYKGKKILLNFWASWCPPCKEEMPYIQKYYEERADKSNVEVITVNMTKHEQGDIERVEKFIEEQKLTFPVLLDENGEIMNLYNIRAFPTTYIINEDGMIADIVSLPLDDKIIEDLIHEQL